MQSLHTPAYRDFRSCVVNEFSSLKPGSFGETLPGILRNLGVKEKVLALTLDGCGWSNSGGYNSGLIELLRREKIPATLFVSGVWIDKNRKVFKELAKDPLFEIENHGLLHRLCSIGGQSKFGVRPTKNISEVVDEIELNGRKIEELTGRKPGFFRPATVYIDEASIKIANKLGYRVVGYSVYTGDARPFQKAAIIKNNILKQARDGGILILHFNHPDWNEAEALREALPGLRAKGYTFVRLEEAVKPEAPVSSAPVCAATGWPVSGKSAAEQRREEALRILREGPAAVRIKYASRNFDVGPSSAAVSVSTAANAPDLKE